ncbi:AraC family transcriptional regulator [Actinacidiphila bryophytorum]|uniref:AraC family transcriptional regulator n=1 Tax=Actinacidiphila bryophytorum TaxID=1436133 RepID=UPI00195F744F|nr:AraC family transcriptional regulator [Actinacidiphila bryophytorum]MBN6545364.1 AraC family transcriptional regulator [Actinacidiphila bryophytorum]
MLDVRVFNSTDLPAADRFDVFQELVDQAHAPMNLTSDFADDFRATLRQFSLGEISLWPTVFPHLNFHRTPRLIRQSDPESCHLTLVLRGGGVARWDRAETVLGPYDFHTNHTSVPYVISSSPGPVDMIGIEVPKTSVNLPWDRVQKVIGQALSGREGVGALLVQFLTQVTSDTSVYLPSEAPRLGRVLSELVTALFARALDEEERLQPETRSRTLALEVKAFVRRNLCDPALTPGAIAAAHFISRSHLHRLFRAEGTTVAAYIRTQRLEAARADLANAPAVPVYVIAARYGFKDHATFTRTFRAVYGTTPRDYRHAPVVRRRP